MLFERGYFVILMMLGEISPLVGLNLLSIFGEVA